MAGKLTLTVSQLCEYIRRMLQLDPMLHGVELKGEISNLKFHQTGTIFFTLKDENAAINCVMYASDAARLQAAPFEGMRAVVSGSVGLYVRGGQMQFYTSSLRAEGVGVLYERLLALKEKLSREGLFEAQRKRPLPPYPDTVGVVSSPTGAVIHDIMNVSLRRDPQARILLCPVRVQGIGAADEVVQAIRLLEKIDSVSVIIVARGGGSREDLWVFNAERIARAASRCKTPLISAIGHEIDFTILDFVADQRAPTPSAAAELAVPDRAEFSRKLCNLEENIHISIQNRLSLCYNRLDETVQPLSRQNMQAQLAGRQQQLEAVSGQLQTAAREKQQDAGLRLRHAAALAATLNPYGVLARGYALVQDEKGRICAPDALREGQKMTLCGAVNRIHCTVDAVEGPNESTQEL